MLWKASPNQIWKSVRASPSEVPSQSGRVSIKSENVSVKVSSHEVHFKSSFMAIKTSPSFTSCHKSIRIVSPFYHLMASLATQDFSHIYVKLVKSCLSQTHLQIKSQVSRDESNLGESKWSLKSSRFKSSLKRLWIVQDKSKSDSGRSMTSLKSVKTIWNTEVQVKSLVNWERSSVKSFGASPTKSQFLQKRFSSLRSCQNKYCVPGDNSKSRDKS